MHFGSEIFSKIPVSQEIQQELNLTSFAKPSIWYSLFFVSKVLGGNNQDNFVLYQNCPHKYLAGFCQAMLSSSLILLLILYKIASFSLNNTKLYRNFSKTILHKGFIFLLCDVLKCYYSVREFFQICIALILEKRGCLQQGGRVLYKESGMAGARQQVGNSTALQSSGCSRGSFFALNFSYIQQEERDAC